MRTTLGMNREGRRTFRNMKRVDIKELTQTTNGARKM